jgi:hypothetical protein
MATIQIFPNQPFLNLFSVNYPSGISGSIVATAIRNNNIVQISNTFGETIINYVILVSPSSGFLTNEFTKKVYTVGVAYEIEYSNGAREIFSEPSRYTVDIYYVNSNPEVDDTTPPVITPKSGTTITIQEDTFVSSTDFINNFFTITDAQSGVESCFFTT